MYSCQHILQNSHSIGVLVWNNVSKKRNNVSKVVLPYMWREHSRMNNGKQEVIMERTEDGVGIAFQTTHTRYTRRTRIRAWIHEDAPDVSECTFSESRCRVNPPLGRQTICRSIRW